MATSSALNLIIDITNPAKSGIIQSFQNRLPQGIPLFIRNDTETVSLRFVQPSSGTSRPWDDVNYTTAATILALGEFDVAPTSGGSTFQFGPKTSGTTNSTTTISITGSTAGIINGMYVAGAGIVPGTTCTISGSTVTLSVAATASASGVTLYFYNETASLPAGSSATTVSTAINSLASVIAAGGVTITEPETGAYLAVLNVSGVTPGYFNGNPAGLNPSSSLVVSEVVVGAVGVASEQLIEIFVNPYALNSSWTPFPAASATVLSVATGASISPTGNNTLGQNTITSLSSTTGIVVGMSVSGPGIPTGTTLLSLVSATATLSNSTTAGSTGGVYVFTTPSVQTITLTPGAYDGSFTITTPLLTTPAIAAILTGATAQAVQSALNVLGASYVVTGNAGGPYTITDPTGSNTPFSVNVAGLIVPIGLTGSLTLSTYAMLQKFITSGLSEITLELECQVTPSGGGQSTPLQLSVLINKNVINLSSLSPSPLLFGLTQAAADARYLQIANWLNSNPTALSVSASGSSTVARGSPTTLQFLTAAIGSGSYTYSLTLGTTGAIRGDRMEVQVSLPSSTNPIIDIIGSSTNAVGGTGSAYTSYNLYWFNGTSWDLIFRSA